MANWNDASQEAWSKAFGLDTTLKDKFGAGSGIASSLMSMGTTAYGLSKDNSKSMQTSVDKQLEQMKALGNNIQVSSMDDVMAQWAGTTLLAGDYDVDDYYTGPSGANIAKGSISSALNGATTGFSVGGPWGALAGGVLGLGSGLVGGALGKSQGEATARQAVSSLRAQEAKTNATIQSQLGLLAGNMSNATLRNSLANIKALGGPLASNGANWTNGLTMINAGGTHSQNPNGGVPMGISADGLPNLVEEGEVVWNDYVFSRRINIPNELKEKYKFKGNDKISFADAVKKLQKSSEEMPNDPIEKRTLDFILSEFMQSQEVIRQKKVGLEEKKIAKALGGHLFYDGGTAMRNFQSPTTGISSKIITRTTKSDDGTITTISKDGRKTDLPTTGWDENLRYIPALGAGIVGITDALGLTNKPDYQYADALTKEAEQYGKSPRVGYKALGDYMAYNPFDRLFYANQVGAQQAATRRGILDLSSGNRGTAMANLLSANYNGILGLGQLYRQGDEYNLAQRQKVAEFNRGTNQANSTMDLKTQLANAEMDKTRNALLMEAATKSALLRQQEDQTSQAAKMANIKSFLTSLGNIGTEAYNRYDRNALLNSGYSGILNSSMKDRAK